MAMHLLCLVPGLGLRNDFRHQLFIQVTTLFHAPFEIDLLLDGTVRKWHTQSVPHIVPCQLRVPLLTATEPAAFTRRPMHHLCLFLLLLVLSWSLLTFTILLTILLITILLLTILPLTILPPTILPPPPPPITLPPISQPPFILPPIILLTILRLIMLLGPIMPATSVRHGRMTRLRLETIRATCKYLSCGHNKHNQYLRRWCDWRDQNAESNRRLCDEGGTNTANKHITCTSEQTLWACVLENGTWQVVTKRNINLLIWTAHEKR